ASRRTARLLTKDLLETLVGRDGEPWGAWWGAALDKGDTRGPGHKLAKLLKPFGIASKTIRLNGQTSPGKGYEVADFADAFARYVSPALLNVTTLQPLGDKGLPLERERYVPEAVTSGPGVQALAAQGLPPRNVVQGESEASRKVMPTVADVLDIFPGARVVT